MLKKEGKSLGKEKSVREDTIEKRMAETQQKLNDAVQKYGLRSKEALQISEELDIIIHQLMKKKQKMKIFSPKD
ncbi:MULTISPECIES: aspartyl-phosphate phosphatase Spo0E family protein [Mesobacillus]|uniref:Aspartyl-phosphate phosphatase Spo0E family protein n=2 Tax=Mesobacillus TaxID=2675231 RepID=A0A0D6ZCQ4_9BACI|nr:MULTISPECIES: aspartyl-phosphate phosphatase Spo0E family protein [Mesobacillus]KIY23070.1 hypothetical protein UB32_04725 [Mesobacillus subterraneus]MDQ0414763.1 hypothetical protein [Mesobacillus stamsii]